MAKRPIRLGPQAPRGRRASGTPKARGEIKEPPRRRPRPASGALSRGAAPPPAGRVRVRLRAFWRLLRNTAALVLVLGVVLFVALSAGGLYYYRQVAGELPDVSLLRSYKPSLVTKVYDRNGKLMREFFIERRFLIHFEEIPSVAIQATLATEDARFEEHSGVDLFGILRAATRNFFEGYIVEGGSTITQQLAKSFFLSSRRSLRRKLSEAILAVRIERHFEKREILNLYLNQIYYGQGAYGIEAAAQVYFGKKAARLTLPEAALLAGLPRAPSIYNPFRSVKLARKRRSHVLRRMLEEGYIKPGEYAEAELAPVQLHRPELLADEANYAVEYVRRRIERQYGSSGLYRSGLRIYTTLDGAIQRAAAEAVRRGILSVDQRQGYRGPLGRVPAGQSETVTWKTVEGFLEKGREWREIRSGKWEPAVVLGVRPGTLQLRLRTGAGLLRIQDARWARRFNPKMDGLQERLESFRGIFRRGEIILVERLSPARGGSVPVALVQAPQVQAATVIIEQETGAIRAMVGGYDYERSEFNRAVQAVRPPGSAFKPVTYSAAISEGWTPSDVIVDAPIIYPGDGSERDWKPTNFTEKFYGPTTLWEAIVRSRNIVTVKLAEAIGMDKVVARARLLGIRSALQPNLALSLGSNGVTLLELTSLYGTIANLGRRVAPHMILRVEDAQGRSLWGVSPESRQTIRPEEAYVMLNLLQGVVASGTASRVRALGRPLAGKTGTTNDYQDAWFVGVSPRYSAGVWVGMDDKTSLGKNETGARAALPIWMEIIGKIYEGKPVRDFRRPEGVTMVWIDRKFGYQISPGGENGVYQAFIAGTEPPFRGEVADTPQRPSRFFREDARPGAPPAREESPAGRSGN
ncbi:MAG: PBP1A family penicillin-binding protein [bacterium]|nr:PBP1A family penicillin-binding protein [bacterium]